MSRVSSRLRARLTVRAGWLVLLLLCGPGWVWADAASSAPDAFEQNGFRVRMETEALGSGGTATVASEGEDVRLRFRVSEAGEGAKAVSGLRPLAWISRRDEGAEFPDRETCEYQIRGFLAGRLARVADVNLNEYLLVTLDDNSSLSVIDPQVESSLTKTLGMVSLPGKGKDLVLAPDRRHIFVSLPEQSRVAIADIITRRARYATVPGHPWRVRLQPDGRFAWIGDRDGTAVTCIDASTFEVRETLEAGGGPHHIDFRDDSRFVYVVGSGSEELTVIDARTLEAVARVRLGGVNTGLAHSAHSGMVYVSQASGDKGRIVAVDAGRHVVSARIELPHPATGVAVAPEGRFGFALHREHDRLSLFDTATNEVVASIRTGRRPSHIEFSDAFAYVRQDGSDEVLLIHLAGLGRSGTPPQVTPVVMWQNSPETGADDTPAPLMTPVPEGGGMFALSTADRSIYHFVEGMNAPMGAYRTYPWPARGVLVVDRAIQERGKGSYETEFRAPGAADYTVHFLVPSSPTLFGCFPIHFRSPPGRKIQKAMRMEVLAGDRRFTAGKPQKLTVRLSDGTNDISDLDDVMVLVLAGPTAQWRGAARPLGKGRYEADAVFPKPGHYMVMVSSRSRGVDFGSLPPGSVWVDDPGEARAAAADEEGPS